MLANRAHLFVFMTNRAVPYTNNISERHLRPSVIFRKVTNGFRCEWGAETYAAFRSVVSTAKANGRSTLGHLRATLAVRLIPTGLCSDRSRPFAGADGGDTVRHSHELVPGLTAGVDDILVGVRRPDC